MQTANFHHFSSRFIQHIALFIAMIALIAGCAPKKEPKCKEVTDFTPPKFRVTLIPVVNCSEDNLPWSVGDELTESVRRALAEKTDVRGCALAEIRYAFQHCEDLGVLRWKVEKDDFSFCSLFGSERPVVVIQLTRHEMIPFQEDELSTLFPAEANVCHQVLRIEARIILLNNLGKIKDEEQISFEHLMDPDWLRYDEREYPWPKASFFLTPLAKAHAEFSKDVALRIEAIVERNAPPPPCPE